MNLILLMVLIAEICLGICFWLTPECLRWIAAHLLTRADVIDAAKRERHRRMQFWQKELGLGCDARSDEVHPLDSIQSMP